MVTLNLEQAAAFLHIHPITLSRKAQSGEVPAAKPAKRWVFVEVDLIEYLRSQYSQQASQGDNDEVTACHSTKMEALPIGMSKSQSKVASLYSARLALPTNKRQRNTKQS